jgi:hypothetical protein
MIRKNIYSRITESIIKAHHDTNLDSAMEDGHEMENMGKKIVAIITADPDQDLDWESEYEPFGASELTADDEQEAMEHEGMESDHELCPSCGYDVDCEGDECEDESEADEYEAAAPVIGGGFESEDDDYEDMDVKDILVDILQELKGEDSDSEDEGAFETSDENPMFGGSEESDDEESDDEDEWEDDSDDEDYDSMLSDNDSDWGNDEEDSDEENYDDEEDFEQPLDEESCEPQEQEEDEVEIFDCLDNA